MEPTSSTDAILGCTDAVPGHTDAVLGRSDPEVVDKRQLPPISTFGPSINLFTGSLLPHHPNHHCGVIELPAAEAKALGVRRECERRDHVLLVLLLPHLLCVLGDTHCTVLETRIRPLARLPSPSEVPCHNGLQLVVEKVVKDPIRSSQDQVASPHIYPHEVRSLEGRAAAAQLVRTIEIVRLVARAEDDPWEENRLFRARGCP
mmetsp:Transcript_30180/g.64218  ORF Transcript_30180/g.64218 Transcript_30180/m.64218 type:complete len:204 (+) Transcript_30180:201-812(+)